MDAELNNKIVYVHLDKQKPGKYVYGEYSFDYLPYYVGQGRPERPNESRAKEGETETVIIKTDLSVKESLELEKYLIKLIGRKCDGGPLENINESFGWDNGRLIREGKHAVCNEENLKYYSENMKLQNKIMLENGTHNSQNPEFNKRLSEWRSRRNRELMAEGKFHLFTDEHKEKVKEGNYRAYVRGTHTACKNFDKRMEFFSTKEDGYELTYEDAKFLGDRQINRLQRNINTMFEFKNVPYKIVRVGWPRKRRFFFLINKTDEEIQEFVQQHGGDYE